MRRAVLGLGAALLLGSAATAQEAPAAGQFPQIAGEVWMGLYSVGNPRSNDPATRGSSTFLFGEVAAGLWLTPNVSVQGMLHVEPIGEQAPNGTNIGFRYQAAYIEALYANWRITERLNLYGGKFTAPFGYGHHAFPGVLPRIRAHEIYMIRESLGFGATWTWLSDTRFGNHDISGALFTLDTTSLSNTLFTRVRCCREGFERYSRNTLSQGGPGNNGRLENFAIALDGDDMPFLPNFAYHLAVVSRAPGKDGTRREWGYAAGARYRAQWNASIATNFFAEFVQFQPAGGAGAVTVPAFEDPFGETLIPPFDAPLVERQRFSTLGAQTTWGPWRATAMWQVNERKRRLAPLPTQQWVELTAGRELPFGFAFDIGYQFTSNGGDEGGRNRADGILARLGYQARF